MAFKKGFTALAHRIEQCRREAILLEDGAVDLQEGKLFICGFEKVGKTTLVENALQMGHRTGLWGVFAGIWDHWKQDPQRTAGFNVTRLHMGNTGFSIGLFY